MEFRSDDKDSLYFWPAVRLVTALDRLNCHIMMLYRGSEYNAKSILSLMSAEVTPGDRVFFLIEGEDKEGAAETLRSFFRGEL